MKKKTYDEKFENELYRQFITLTLGQQALDKLDDTIKKEKNKRAIKVHEDINAADTMSFATMFPVWCMEKEQYILDYITRMQPTPAELNKTPITVKNYIKLLEKALIKTFDINKYDNKDEQNDY